MAFSAPYPGKIIPVDMAAIGGHQICQKDAFLCAALGTKVSIAFNRKLGAGFFGGEGFILQRLEGDGMTFIHVGGTIVKKELNGQRLMVDTGCIVAFSQGIDVRGELMAATICRKKKGGGKPGRVGKSAALPTIVCITILGQNDKSDGLKFINNYGTAWQTASSAMRQRRLKNGSFGVRAQPSSDMGLNTANRPPRQILG